eukprot:2015867-Prymnesium_polylepis.1
MIPSKFPQHATSSTPSRMPSRRATRPQMDVTCAPVQQKGRRPEPSVPHSSWISLSAASSSRVEPRPCPQPNATVGAAIGGTLRSPLFSGAACSAVMSAGAFHSARSAPPRPSAAAIVPPAAATSTRRPSPAIGLIPRCEASAVAAGEQPRSSRASCSLIRQTTACAPNTNTAPLASAAATTGRSPSS